MTITQSTIKTQKDLRVHESVLEEYFLLRTEGDHKKYYHIILTMNEQRMYKLWAFWARVGNNIRPGHIVKAVAFDAETAIKKLHSLLSAKVKRSVNPYSVVNHSTI